MDKQELIEKHTDDVKKAVSKYYRSIPNKDKCPSDLYKDMLAAGNLALVEAAERFDDSMGYKFITYAYQWIDNAIKNELYYLLGPIEISLDDENAPELKDDKEDTQEAAIEQVEAGGANDSTTIILSKLDDMGMNEKEKAVFCRIWGIGCEAVKNTRRIAKELKLTEMEVRRLKQSAEQKYKKGGFHVG